MSQPQGGRNKKRDRKRTEREKLKRRRRAQGTTASTWSMRMKRAAHWPLLECQINTDFRESGMAQVLIARKGPADIALGVFLVDLCCMGVKNCILRDDLGREQYKDLIAGLTAKEPFDSCEPAFAVKLVQTGVRYAHDLGFRPHPDYRAAREMFGDIDPDRCDEEIPCGRDGKPFYVQGPHDDAAEILRRLEERVGSDGFHFIAGLHEIDELVESEAPRGNDFE